MTADTGKPRWALPISLFIAYLLTVLPLPDVLREFRPDWIALIIVYWVMMVPGRVGLVTAFVAGLLLDTLTGSLLGQHALALVVLAYLVLKIHLRVRVFPLGQQTVFVVALLVVYHFFLFWVDGAAGVSLNWQRRWLPLLPDALVWPLLVVLLNAWRGRTRRQ